MAPSAALRACRSAVFEKSRKRVHTFEYVFTAYRVFHSNLCFLEVVPETTHFEMRVPAAKLQCNFGGVLDMKKD